MATPTLRKAPAKGLAEIDNHEVKTATNEKSPEGLLLTKDEYHLAQLGYKQTLHRGLGLIENFIATFVTMNFVSGLAVLFGFAMYTGGPQAALANWTMVGGLSLIVALTMAEIAAALPTAGGIYYWSAYLGGPEWGPFLGWTTAWWNWAGWIAVVPATQQGATNFLFSALQILYPDSTILSEGWFSWLITSLMIILAAIPNIYSQTVLKWTLRTTIITFTILYISYMVWVPAATAHSGQFQDRKILTTFVNGINESDPPQASNAYCWIVGILFGAWDFYGWDASVHLSEETKHAGTSTARGMWLGVLASWCLSVPTLLVFLFCIQNLDAINSAKYSNNFAELLVQTVGRNGAAAILIICWIDNSIQLCVCILSAQRVTYAIARDGVLPGSKYLARVSKKNKMPVNAAVLVVVLGIAIEAAIIGSAVAFEALTAVGTIAVNISYLIPIVARHTIGRKRFQPAAWNLGIFSPFLAAIASIWICFLVVVLVLPQLYPVTAVC